MGAQASAASRRQEASVSGGREQNYAREGNYWEVTGHADELLPVTEAEASETQAKLQKIKGRHELEIGDPADIQFAMVGLRSRWIEGGDTQAKMVALRAAHRAALIAWETEAQRECAHCKLVIENELSQPVGNGVYVHSACFEAYSVEAAPLCQHCHRKILPEGHAASIGGLSGRRVVLSGGGEVHTECQEAYVLEMDGQCAHCGERLGGEFAIATDGEKLHGRCVEEYSHRHGLQCLQCGRAFQPVRNTSITHQRVKFEGGWCHQGPCALAYFKAHAPPPRCRQCAEPIVPGASASYYTSAKLRELGLPESACEGQVHSHCLEAFLQAHPVTAAGAGADELGESVLRLPT